MEAFLKEFCPVSPTLTGPEGSSSPVPVRSWSGRRRFRLSGGSEASEVFTDPSLKLSGPAEEEYSDEDAFAEVEDDFLESEATPPRQGRHRCDVKDASAAR
eukprot:scaffold385_cov305-Pinguiococcus_pyrenoidosus.AAC.22